MLKNEQCHFAVVKKKRGGGLKFSATPATRKKTILLFLTYS